MNQNSIKKFNLHKRNKHSNGYDFDVLKASYPVLSSFISLNKYGNESVNFFDPKAVKALNTALLIHHYGLEYWDVPDGYLCPPIPGRADLVHYIADLIVEKSNANEIKCLDIGCGANCIYPLIGSKTYGWSFVGTDIDVIALESAHKIISKNPGLEKLITLKHQPDSKKIFENIIDKDDFFDVVICNPPFHSSAKEAYESSTRKLRNLTKKRVTKTVRNFGGQNNELWTEGGEFQFISDMINESKNYSKSVNWFTTLVSKGANLGHHFNQLDAVNALDVKTITMSQGSKISRILAWRYN